MINLFEYKFLESLIDKIDNDSILSDNYVNYYTLLKEKKLTYNDKENYLIDIKESINKSNIELEDMIFFIKDTGNEYKILSDINVYLSLEINLIGILKSITYQIIENEFIYK